MKKASLKEKMSPLKNKKNSLIEEKKTEQDEEIEKLYYDLIEKQNLGYPIEEYFQNDKNIIKYISYIMTKPKKNDIDIYVCKNYLKTLEKFTKILKNTNVSLDELMNKVASMMKYEEYVENSLLCKLGDKGDKFFLIFKGTISVIIPKENSIKMSNIEYIKYLLLLAIYQENELINKLLVLNKDIYFIEDKEIFCMIGIFRLYRFLVDRNVIGEYNFLIDFLNANPFYNDIIKNKFNIVPDNALHILNIDDLATRNLYEFYCELSEDIFKKLEINYNNKIEKIQGNYKNNSYYNFVHLIKKSNKRLSIYNLRSPFKKYSQLREMEKIQEQKEKEKEEEMKKENEENNNENTLNNSNKKEEEKKEQSPTQLSPSISKKDSISSPSNTKNLFQIINLHSLNENQENLNNESYSPIIRPHNKKTKEKLIEKYTNLLSSPIIPNEYIYYCSIEDYCKRIIPKFILKYNDNPNPLLKYFSYIEVTDLTEGNIFGEVALQNVSKKRTASIITKSHLHVGILTKNLYDNCLKSTQEKIRQLNIKFFVNGQIFDKINPILFEQKYFNWFKQIHLIEPSNIFKQGEERKYIYFIKSGEIELTAKMTFKEINKIIKDFGGEIYDEDGIRKVCNEEIDFNRFYHHESHFFKICRLNDNEIIGLDDFILENNLFLFNCNSISLNLTMFLLEKNFYDTLFEDKTIKKNIQNYTKIKRKIMCQRLIDIRQAMIENEILKIQDKNIKNYIINKSKRIKNKKASLVLPLMESAVLNPISLTNNKLIKKESKRKNTCINNFIHPNKNQLINQFINTEEIKNNKEFIKKRNLISLNINSSSDFSNTTKNSTKNNINLISNSNPYSHRKIDTYTTKSNFIENNKINIKNIRNQSLNLYSINSVNESVKINYNKTYSNELNLLINNQPIKKLRESRKKKVYLSNIRNKPIRKYIKNYYSQKPINNEEKFYVSNGRKIYDGLLNQTKKNKGIVDLICLDKWGEKNYNKYEYEI